jgi:hypothetical protein
METYLPLLKTLFADWMQLAITEPMYAGAIAFIAWVLTASLYSIKIAFLNKQSTSRENARIDAINQLSAAQLQLQDIQQLLLENTEQLRKNQESAQNATQQASKLEDQLKERNKQIATTIQSFSTSFDLGERPLPLTEDLKAESLWQQFDRTINLLIIRLQNEQQAKAELQEAFHTETLKSAENGAVISTLQAGISAQAIKISNLEIQLEEQQNHAQLVLDKNSSNIKPEVIDNNIQTKLSIASVNSQPPVNETLMPAPSETITSNDLIKESLPTELKTIPTEIPELPPINSSKNQLGKLKSLFGKTLQKTTVTSSESIKNEQIDSTTHQKLEIEAPSVTPTKNPLKKMKYYFGDTEPTTETKLEATEAPSVPVKIETTPISTNKLSFGKLKGLISKLT